MTSSMTGYGLIVIRNQSKKISRSNPGILISAEGYGQMKIPKHKKKSNPIAKDLMTSKYKPIALPNKKKEQKKVGYSNQDTGDSK